MKRSSSTSTRQSLGLPSRNFAHNDKDIELSRKSRLPVGLSSGQTNMAASNTSQQRRTYSKPSMSGALGSARPSSQYGRRQTQAPPGGSRVSTGRSSMYGQVSQMKKDPRPLSDKSYQAASIRKLIAFLLESNYPKMYTPKSLQTPTCKEFLYIFNYLIEMIDETLVVQGVDIVESVPKVLKRLGYPFTVSKNHLLNVGSPHTWPILLGVLTWLIDCCSIPDRTSEIMFKYGQEDFDDDNGADNGGETEYKVMEMMYAVYMRHGKTSEDYHCLEEQRLDAIRGELEQYNHAIDKLQEGYAQLSQVKEELSKSSIPAMQEELKTIQAQCKQLKDNLESDLLPRIQHLEEICQEKDAATCEIEIQIEVNKQNAKELQEHIRQQPMSSKEVQEIHQWQKENYEMLDKYRAMVDEWNQKISELQMQHNRTVSGIDGECSQANELLRKVAIALPDAASLSRLDYDTSKRADPEALQNIVKHAHTLKHELKILEQRVASTNSDMENKIIIGETTLSTLQSELVRKTLEIENAKHRLTIDKDALEKKKQEFQSAMKSEQTEKHSLEKQLMTLQGKIQQESGAEKEYLATKKGLELEQVNAEREICEKDKKYIEFIESVLDLLEIVKLHQKTMKERVEKLVENYRKVTIPTVDPKYLI